MLLLNWTLEPRDAEQFASVQASGPGLAQRPQERHRVSPDRARDGHELDDVEPSLATLVLRHERLRPAEPLGQGVRGLISV